MTIKGGTSLRLEGVSKALAFSSIAAIPAESSARPAVAAFKMLDNGVFGGVFHDSFVIVDALTRADGVP
jgi:hypothetical protein